MQDFLFPEFDGKASVGECGCACVWPRSLLYIYRILKQFLLFFRGNMLQFRRHKNANVLPCVCAESEEEEESEEDALSRFKWKAMEIRRFPLSSQPSGGTSASFLGRAELRSIS